MNETHYDYAMKIFNKNVLRGIKDFVKDEVTGKMKRKDALEDVNNEIEIMKQLDSDCVVRLHEVIDNEDGNSLVLVLDYCA